MFSRPRSLKERYTRSMEKLTFNEFIYIYMMYIFSFIIVIFSAS